MSMKIMTSKYTDQPRILRPMSDEMRAFASDYTKRLKELCPPGPECLPFYANNLSSAFDAIRKGEPWHEIGYGDFVFIGPGEFMPNMESVVENSFGRPILSGYFSNENADGLYTMIGRNLLGIYSVYDNSVCSRDFVGCRLIKGLDIYQGSKLPSYAETDGISLVVVNDNGIPKFQLLNAATREEIIRFSEHKKVGWTNDEKFLKVRINIESMEGKYL